MVSVTHILPSLPGVGLIDIDDIAQSQCWNTGVEQSLLGQKEQKHKSIQEPQQAQRRS